MPQPNPNPNPNLILTTSRARKCVTWSTGERVESTIHDERHVYCIGWHLNLHHVGLWVLSPGA